MKRREAHDRLLALAEQLKAQLEAAEIDSYEAFARQGRELLLQQPQAPAPRRRTRDPLLEHAARLRDQFEREQLLEGVIGDASDTGDGGSGLG